MNFDYSNFFQGNPDLIKTACECGLGGKNSLGMGMM
ncbi:CRISPR-associated endoribonuclease Cas6 [Fonticella tunisiensis]